MTVPEGSNEKRGKTCPNCGKVFGEHLSSRSRKIFCCKKCYDEYRHKHTFIQHECPVCGKKYEDSYCVPRGYCSKECYYIWKTGKTYEEIFGKEKGSTYRYSKKSKGNGLTYEEQFGKEKAEKIIEKIKKSKKHIDRELHPSLVNKYIHSYTEQGFRCVRIDERPLPDFIAIKDNEVFAVEIQNRNMNRRKYNNCKEYDDIHWIIFNKNGKLTFKNQKETGNE